MPVYTYRREDGTTFDFRQKFTDEPLQVDPQTGQHVTRVIQAAGVIFKGSGFYVNDSKSASRSSVTAPAKSEKSETTASEAKTETKSEASSTESSTKASAEPAKSSTPAPAPAAAD